MFRGSILVLGRMVATGIGLSGHPPSSVMLQSMAGDASAAPAEQRAVLQELRQYDADLSARDGTAFASRFDGKRRSSFPS